MITDPLAIPIGKIVVCWTPTSSFSAKLMSVFELWFGDRSGWRRLVDSTEIFYIGVMRRCLMPCAFLCNKMIYHMMLMVFALHKKMIYIS
jgi:hypothetical protein